MTFYANKELNLEQWIVSRLAAILGVSSNEIDVHEPIQYYGLQSVEAISLMSELSDHIGRPLSPTLWWDCKTVAQLVARLDAADATEEAEAS